MRRRGPSVLRNPRAANACKGRQGGCWANLARAHRQTTPATHPRVFANLPSWSPITAFGHDNTALLSYKQRNKRRNPRLVTMLAAHPDQENLARQGTRHLQPKTPGARYPKTPLKVPLNDENAAHHGKAGLVARSRPAGNENTVMRGKAQALATPGAIDGACSNQAKLTGL